MTREEAIAEMKKLRALMLFDPMTGEEIDYNMLNDENKDLYDAAGVALAALRGSAREMVEQMRGEWAHTYSCDNFWTEVWKCVRCGFEDSYGDCFDFCPICGAPMTDEAVEMLCKKLEGIQ